MSVSPSTHWTPSNKRNPCPICGRTKDGSCSVRPDGALAACHYGSTHHPPENLKPGDVISGGDGQAWAYTRDASDGRTAVFTLHKPRETTRSNVVSMARRRVVPAAPKRAPAPLPNIITLARLPHPAEVSGSPYGYGEGQRVRRTDRPDGTKTFLPQHLAAGQWIAGAGPDPWPAWHEAGAITHGAGAWVLELEGEKCAGIARAGGAVAITQPGHAHKIEQIQPRYARLHGAGVAGVVFLADHDAQGERRAQEAAEAAAATGMPFLHLPAIDVWSDVPVGGSIDDRDGHPADLISEVQAAISAVLQPQPQPAPEANDDAAATQQTDLQRIRRAADLVVAEDINRSRPQYLHRLRELVEADLTIPARDDLYRREIGEAIIRRDGIESSPFVGGQELPDDDDEWLIAGLILAGALNIVGADPKAGKTLWSVALIASLLHGGQQFIGRDITNRPQTVIIVGPDQPVKLWKRQLKGVGLVEGNTLDKRIVRLWDSHNPWAATPEGIAELRQVCAEHPGSLVLVDSFAKVSEKLGIDENSREAAEVLTDIERACIVHRCTPLVIHHNAKAAGRIGIVNGAALRGNGAIRANASQLLILTLIEPDNPKDPRRRLVTEGRGTEFIDNVIQLEDDGRSWRHVCEFSEHRNAAKVEKAREKLTTRQVEALQVLEASSEPLTTAQVWAQAYPSEPWDKGSNECKQLSRTLGQLLDKRLVTRHPGIANRPTWSA